MRVSLIVMAAALLCVAVASSAATAAPGKVGVRYQWQGTSGALNVKAPLGTPYSATNSEGLVIVAGVMNAPMAAIPAPNTGPDAAGVVMTVAVGDNVFFISDPEWQWD